MTFIASGKISGSAAPSPPDSSAERPAASPTVKRSWLSCEDCEDRYLGIVSRYVEMTKDELPKNEENVNLG